MGFKSYVLLAVLWTWTAGGSLLSGETIERLDRVAEAVMSCKLNAGLTIAMVKNDTTVLTRGYGSRDLQRDLPMTNTTPTSIGSLSKAFTATLIADGVARGLFTWDTPLRDIIPGFGMVGDFRTQRVSMRDALSHKMGIPSYWGVTTACLNVSRTELVRRMRHFPPIHDFRSQFRYCNYGYVLAGHALEVMEGKSWEQIVKEKIFRPLGMETARTADDIRTDEDWRLAAWSHTPLTGGTNLSRNPDQFQAPLISEIGPGGSVYAAAEDMAKWMRFHLREGKNESGHQLIDARQLRETYRPTSVSGSRSQTRARFPVDDVSFTYGMAWRNGMYRGLEKIFHTGSYSSHNCKMTLLPAADLGVWACVNSPGDSRGSGAVNVMNMYMLDILLGKEPWLNASTVCSYPEPWRSMSASKTSMPDEGKVDEDDEIIGGETSTQEKASSMMVNTFDVQNKHQYIGIYKHRAFGDFHVYEDVNGTMRYKMGLFLNGALSALEREDRLNMTIEYPLHYRTVSQTGRTLHFSQKATVDLTMKYTRVTVPYLESSLPPVFERSLAVPSSPPPSTPAAASAPGAHHFSLLILFISLTCGVPLF